ncbi:MAG: hypothetical protein HY542_06640, partial [Deltaproteobacteria bacterium]|nr:hypothetical protein [Deltaproteobacteria bacterium]
MRSLILKALRPLVSRPDQTTEVAAVAVQAASRVVEVIERGAARLYRSSERARVRGIAHPIFDSVARRVLWLSGTPIWKTHERSPEQTIILTRILRAVRTTERPVIVIDLDDTLFATQFKNVAIYREYGRKQGVPLMEMIGPEHLASWNKETVLVDNLGLDRGWFQKHVDEFELFWGERFFTDDYLIYDPPFPGAADYLRKLHGAGVHIVYLSGRPEMRMKTGTIRALRRHHFPGPDEERVTLMLKTPEFDPVFQAKMPARERVQKAGRSDVAFKEWAVQQIRGLGSVVACIDNEPANINLLRDRLFPNGEGLAVWVATAMARPDIIP